MEKFFQNPEKLWNFLIKAQTENFVSEYRSWYTLYRSKKLVYFSWTLLIHSSLQSFDKAKACPANANAISKSSHNNWNRECNLKSIFFSIRESYLVSRDINRFATENEEEEKEEKKRLQFNWVILNGTKQRKESLRSFYNLFICPRSWIGLLELFSGKLWKETNGTFTNGNWFFEVSCALRQ